MAYYDFNPLKSVESSVVTLLRNNSVGIIGFNLYYNNMTMLFELKLAHSNGYTHTLSQYEPFNLISKLGQYVNPQ